MITIIKYISYHPPSPGKDYLKTIPRLDQIGEWFRIKKHIKEEFYGGECETGKINVMSVPLPGEDSRMNRAEIS